MEGILVAELMLKVANAGIRVLQVLSRQLYHLLSRKGSRCEAHYRRYLRPKLDRGAGSGKKQRPMLTYGCGTSTQECGSLQPCHQAMVHNGDYLTSHYVTK